MRKISNRLKKHCGRNPSVKVIQARHKLVRKTMSQLSLKVILIKNQRLKEQKLPCKILPSKVNLV